MLFNTHILLPALFITLSGVLAQETGVATSGTPDVAYTSDNAFVFCSDQDCTGTCEVVSTEDVERDEGEYAPNSMGFQSIYWYNPGNYGWTLYTCIGEYNCDSAATIGSNTCYNLYDNGVATDFYEYWYFIDGGKQ